MIPKELNGSLGGATYRATVDDAPRQSGEYEVKMTANEVAVLKFILNHIGGSPSGARAYADSLREKLLEIQVKCDQPLKMRCVAQNSIYI